MRGKIFFSGLLLLTLIALSCSFLAPAEAITRTTTKRRATMPQRRATHRRFPNTNQWRNWQGTRPVFPVDKLSSKTTAEALNKTMIVSEEVEFLPATVGTGRHHVLVAAPIEEGIFPPPRFLLEAGLAGSALFGELLFAQPIASSLELHSGLALGAGGGYTMTILDLIRLNFLAEGFNYGLGLSYLMRSDQPSRPTMELFFQRKFYGQRWRFAFNTALNFRVGASWEWR